MSRLYLKNKPNKNTSIMDDILHHNPNENLPKVLKAYKKRERAMQQRISAEKNINMRLWLLLRKCLPLLPKGVVRELVEHELKMDRDYKYYKR